MGLYPLGVVVKPGLHAPFSGKNDVKRDPVKYNCHPDFNQNRNEPRHESPTPPIRRDATALRDLALALPRTRD